MGPCAQDLNSYWQMGEIENNWSKQPESGAVCKSVIGWASPWARGGITGSWTLTTLDADTWSKWLWILHSGFMQHQWAELSLCIQGNWSFQIESHASYSWNSLRTPKKHDRTKVLTIHLCTLLTQFYSCHKSGSSVVQYAPAAFVSKPLSTSVHLHVWDRHCPLKCKVFKIQELYCQWNSIQYTKILFHPNPPWCIYQCVKDPRDLKIAFTNK